MSIASRVKWFLDVNRVRYEVVTQSEDCVSDASEPTPIPPEKIARAELLEDESGYLMPVLPADRRLNLDELRRQLARDLRPTAREDADSLFFDCNGGGIPAVGAAYGIRTIVDDELVGVSDIYFDGGDREDLVHMEGEVFLALIADGNHAAFSAVS